MWANNVIQKTWLSVITKANSNTGLVQDPNLPAGQGDIFFFGNSIGDTGAGDTVKNALVNAIDESGIRLHGEIRANNIPITNVYDMNRDGCVNALDESIARLNATNPSTTLKYLNLPTPAAAPQAAGGDSVSPLVASDSGVAWAWRGRLRAVRKTELPSG